MQEDQGSTTSDTASHVPQKNTVSITLIIDTLEKDWQLCRQNILNLENKSLTILDSGSMVTSDMDAIIALCDLITQNKDLNNKQIANKNKKPAHLGGRPGRHTHSSLDAYPFQLDVVDRSFQTQDPLPSITRALPRMPPQAVGSNSDLTPLTSNAFNDAMPVSNQLRPTSMPQALHGVAQDTPVSSSQAPETGDIKYSVTPIDAIRFIHEDMSSYRTTAKQIWSVATTWKVMASQKPQFVASNLIPRTNPDEFMLQRSDDEGSCSSLRDLGITPQSMCVPFLSDIEPCGYPICGVDQNDAIPPVAAYHDDDGLRKDFLDIVARVLSYASNARIATQWSSQKKSELMTLLRDESYRAEINEWHRQILLALSQSRGTIAEDDSRRRQRMFASTGPVFPNEDDMPQVEPEPYYGDYQGSYYHDMHPPNAMVPQEKQTTAIANPHLASLWAARYRDRRAPALGSTARMRRPKTTLPTDFDSIDPDSIDHDIWNTGESVDAPTADLYIKKFGAVPLGFDINEHADKDEGEIAGMFRPVKGVYFVKYNAMWFAEWHDLDRTRHRTRFSVHKYGHCQARALAIEKRGEADRIKNRQLIERNARLKNHVTKPPSIYALSYKIGPTWTGLPDADVVAGPKEKRKAVPVAVKKLKKRDKGSH